MILLFVHDSVSSSEKPKLRNETLFRSKKCDSFMMINISENFFAPSEILYVILIPLKFHDLG